MLLVPWLHIGENGASAPSDSAQNTFSLHAKSHRGKKGGGRTVIRRGGGEETQGPQHTPAMSVNAFNGTTLRQLTKRKILLRGDPTTIAAWIRAVSDRPKALPSPYWNCGSGKTEGEEHAEKSPQRGPPGRNWNEIREVVPY